MGFDDQKALNQERISMRDGKGTKRPVRTLISSSLFVKDSYKLKGSLGAG